MGEGKAGHGLKRIGEDVLLRRVHGAAKVGGLARWEGEKGGKRRPET